MFFNMGCLTTPSFDIQGFSWQSLGPSSDTNFQAHGFHHKGLGVPTQKVNLLSGVAQSLIHPISFPCFVNVGLFATYTQHVSHSGICGHDSLGKTKIICILLLVDTFLQWHISVYDIGQCILIQCFCETWFKNDILSSINDFLLRLFFISNVCTFFI